MPLTPIDAAHCVGQAASAKLLLQFARRDAFISPWDAEIYIQAASDPKEVKWYDNDHFFEKHTPRARKERMDWLLRALACKRSDHFGLHTRVPPIGPMQPPKMTTLGTSSP
jgi:fermentation-respiration switch protein FrsA (DUF1100 family)